MVHRVKEHPVPIFGASRCQPIWGKDSMPFEDKPLRHMEGLCSLVICGVDRLLDLHCCSKFA